MNEYEKRRSSGEIRNFHFHKYHEESLAETAQQFEDELYFLNIWDRVLERKAYGKYALYVSK